MSTQHEADRLAEQIKQQVDNQYGYAPEIDELVDALAALAKQQAHEATAEPAAVPVGLSGRVHILKTDPVVFDAVAAGLKTHEIRLNDRDFRLGDKLVLKRTQYSGWQMKDGLPLVYTGEECERVVSHILAGYGLETGWVILSFAAQGTQKAEAVAQDQGTARLLDALDSIRRYGLDTLSGRTDGPDDREWQRAAVNEMTKRARLAVEGKTWDATPPKAEATQAAANAEFAGHMDALKGAQEAAERWMDASSPLAARLEPILDRHLGMMAGDDHSEEATQAAQAVPTEDQIDTMLAEHEVALTSEQREGVHAAFRDLLAAPPTQQLSDEQIDAVTQEQWGGPQGVVYQAFRSYARAILAKAAST